ncbi:hypothetical protein HYALB_00012411 [Hymenoscyphus albidus]|uniref:Azaphilone pigments biosynthesis cluster protein L N-terminal domain-containing protein n=1 Tax=Hymenoscyphus albidus TaxID=595503 RepID=A0A9N9PXZ1_9HELO|nr:hypothetical protein HYALB_00012411 [Hymenoscyphus albidus]
MDPITAVGAVASIITLAQTALSLSKALYTLGSAVQSASEDIQALADDLKTFAQSLSLLSRLLEDSKSWYSDDVYLLTAKIIRDCAEMYEKIDKILVKLGSNGKNSWNIRMKFVYKEGEIRRLMKRLRDMKGTLATVLMSLQVDLQLSLLNISSSSKIQRSPEKELDSETIRHLKAAQYAVESCNVLPKYSESSESKSIINDAKIHQTEIDKEPKPIKLLARTTNTRSFVAFSGKQPSSDTVPNLICKSTTGPVFAKLNPAGKAKAEESEVGSLKSVSSTESFKSAISVQKEVLDLAQEVKPVKAVLHAFRTALDTLETLITRLIPENETCYPSAL